MAYKLLVIDDDPQILRVIKNTFEYEGYEVTCLEGIEDIDLCLFQGYDLILLDIMMPVSGLDICKSIRDKVKVPILFLTAKDLEKDVMEGIGAGADDYIKKPFGIRELSARVRMHLRREERNRGTSSILQFGRLEIREEEQKLLIEGQEIPLTKREYDIVILLAKSPGKIFHREEIFEYVYPQSSDTQFRSVAEYIYQIRNKCKPFGINPIETMWGGGYRWRKEEAFEN